MWNEAMWRAEINKEILERAQQLLDEGDVEAAKAVDWKLLSANQRFVDEWVNRHVPTDPSEKAEIERMRIKAGGGLDDKRLKELAEQLAQGDEGSDDDDKVSMGDSLGSHDEL
eukprot:SRR837773.21717.p3 GENE.SRR837773.21717~~SRR837773.21717.p3  ORF type:complete len:113 (-),score=37.18 SRR837773.21717:13-351(-)